MSLKKIHNGAGDTLQLFHVGALQFHFNPVSVQEIQESREPKVLPVLVSKMAECATNSQHLAGIEQVASTAS